MPKIVQPVQVSMQWLATEQGLDADKFGRIPIQMLRLLDAFSNFISCRFKLLVRVASSEPIETEQSR